MATTELAERAVIGKQMLQAGATHLASHHDGGAGAIANPNAGGELSRVTSLQDVENSGANAMRNLLKNFPRRAV